MSDYFDTTMQTLGDLIAFETLSSESNLAIIDYICERLSGCSSRIDLFHDETGQRANLFATIGPEIDGGIILSGHTDVVPVEGQVWSNNPFKMREEGGRYFGRGSCDMKGFLAACLALAPSYAARRLEKPIHFSFTYDEETGCIGACELMKSLKDYSLKPALAIVGEPTGMQVIEGHKGCYEYSVFFTGLEGHGSSPEKGVNALEYCGRYIGKLLELKERLKERALATSPFDPAWSTLNIGLVRGGTARNIIAGQCQIDWEMRPVQLEDAEFVKTELQNYCESELLPEMRSGWPAADIRLEIVGEITSLMPTQQNEARTLGLALTGSNRAGVVAFGTEAGLFQSLGLSVILCGPGSIEQAHKPDEYVTGEQMRACLSMLEALGEKMETRK